MADVAGREIVPGAHRHHVGRIERHVPRPCDRRANPKGWWAARGSFQENLQPLEDRAQDIAHLARLVRRSRVTDVAEVGGDGIATVNRLQGAQHPERLVNREEIVGEALDLEDRKLRRAGGRVGPDAIPERELPVHRAVSLDAVDHLLRCRRLVARLGRVDLRVPHREIGRIVRIGQGDRRGTDAGEIQTIEEAQLHASRWRRRVTGPPIGDQRVQQIAPGRDRHDGSDLHRLFDRAREDRFDGRQPGMRAAIRGARDGDGDCVGLEPSVVHDLTDHAAQVCQLHIHVAEVRLAP